MTGTDGEMAGTDAGGGEAMLRIAHLSPDAPEVDVAVDGTTILEGVAFETVSDYQSLSTGDHQVTVTPTGGDSPVFDQSVTVASGRQTAAAIGTASGESQPLTVTLVTDDPVETESGTASVRAFHAIPDAEAVDVTAGDTVVADGLEFGSASAYISAPSSISQVELRPDSEANDAEPIATFDIDLSEGAAHTAFATGLVEGEPAPNVVVETDTSPTDVGTDTGGMVTETAEMGTDEMGPETATGTDGGL